MYAHFHSHDILQPMAIVAIELIDNEDISHTTYHSPCGCGVLMLHHRRMSKLMHGSPSNGKKASPFFHMCYRQKCLDLWMETEYVRIGYFDCHEQHLVP